MSEKKPLSKLVKYTYGVADLFQSTLNNSSNYMWNFVLTNVLMFSNATVLKISGISSTVTLIATFFTGIIVSGLPALKWGRHRSFIMVFPVVVSIGYVLKYTALSDNENVAAAILIVCVCLANFFHSFVSVSHAALVNVFTENPAERGMLASHRATCVAFASVITSYTTVPLVAKLQDRGMSARSSYVAMAVIICVLYTLAMWYTAWLAKDYEGPYAPDHKTDERPSVIKILSCLVTNPNLIALVIADILRFCGNLTLTGTVAYYYRYVILDYSKMATFTLFAGIVQTIGAYVSGRLTKLSSKFKIVFGEIAIGVCLIIVRFVGFKLVPSYIFLWTYRFFQGFTFSMFFALYADSTVYGEWKTGAFVPGFTSNMYSISARLGEMCKGWVLPLLLIAINFNNQIPAEEWTIEMRTSILNVFTLFPAACRILGGLILLFGFRLTPEKLEQCRKELEERKAAQAAQ